MPKLSFEILDAPSKDDITTIKSIFLDAFTTAYKELDAKKDLYLDDYDDKNVWLTDTIDEELDAISNNDQKKILIVRRDGKIIGFVTFDETTLETDKKIYLSQLSIEPQHWRNKIASKILQHLLTQRPQCDTFWLVIRKINDPGIKFYSKLNFADSDASREGYNENYIGKSAAAAELVKIFQDMFGEETPLPHSTSTSIIQQPVDTEEDKVHETAHLL